ncbi:response regulator transcription factor [Oleisolibacter albus]|uniref:response regulator transcription factor n=1 Tax=Oleisolibacter albus TaxID=2171757 RepID=UPI000DF41738|nr:response regulator [Oleisolibacter albus]
MASELDFHGLHVVLVDRDSSIRRLVRSILARDGITAFTECAAVQDVAGALNGILPDLMIVDADPPDGDGLKFIHAVRHSLGALNPFACIIATTWQPTNALMMRFAASGADDLLVKPFSAKQVHDRLLNLVEARKKFVVSSDYIGPDRRRHPREGQQVPLTEVPNTLRQKALGQYDKARVTEEISAALAGINGQKIMRQAFQIAFLVDFALPGLAHTPPDRMAVEHLLRATITLDDMLRRLPADAERSGIDGPVTTIRQHIDRFKAALDRPLADPAGLARATLDLAAMICRRGDRGQLEQEVSVAVTAYRTRLEQLAQAKAHSAPEAASA